MKRHSHEQELSNGNKLKRAVGAGLAASGLFLVGCSNDSGIHIKYNDGTEQSVDDYLEDYKPVNGEGQPTYGSDMSRSERDALPPEDYEKVDIELRTADRVGKFYEYLHTAWDGIHDVSRSQLTTEEANAIVMPDLNKPREQWTDKEYQSYWSLAVWLVSSQGVEREARDEGLRALTVVALPDSPSYEHLKTKLSSEARSIKSIYEVVDDSRFSGMHLQNVDVGDIHIGNDGGRLVAHKLVGGDGDLNFSLYVNMGNDGSGRTIPVKVASYDSMAHPDLEQLIRQYK